VIESLEVPDASLRGAAARRRPRSVALRLAVPLIAAVLPLLAGCGNTRTTARRAARPASPEAAAVQMGGVRLVYQALSSREAPPPAAAVQQAATVVRARLAALGARHASVEVRGSALGVIVPGVTSTVAIRKSVEATGQLAIYDWASDLIGPRAGTKPYRAVMLASRGSGVRRAAGAGGVDPAGVRWYLVDDRAHRVVAGPVWSRVQLLHGPSLPVGWRTVSIPSGKVVIEDRRRRGRWYVLADDPSLTREDIGSASENADGTQVALHFTPRGRQAFQRLTLRLAARARHASSRRTTQRFAIVLDQQLVALPVLSAQAQTASTDTYSGRIAGSAKGALTFTALVNARPLSVQLALISARTIAASVQPVIGSSSRRLSRVRDR
jgi:preprotein translocase subunit SecD